MGADTDQIRKLVCGCGSKFFFVSCMQLTCNFLGEERSDISYAVCGANSVVSNSCTLCVTIWQRLQYIIFKIFDFFNFSKYSKSHVCRIRQSSCTHSKSLKATYVCLDARHTRKQLREIQHAMLFAISDTTTLYCHEKHTP